MAVSVNLVGNVGKDPETKTFQNGGSVTSFTVGVSQGYFDKRNQWQDQGTMWLEVEPITQGAKSQLQYVHKGDKVHVSGLLSQRFFTRNDGTPGSALRVAAQTLSFIHRQPKDQQAGFADNRNRYSDGYSGGATTQPAAAPPEDPWSQPPTDFGNEPDPEF